jgi:capsular polysaccharide biosynthesis protein
LGAWVIGAGALASLVIGVTVALLSHLFRRGYLSPEALERRLGVPVLASIPDLSRLDRSFDRLSDYG